MQKNVKQNIIKAFADRFCFFVVSFFLNFGGHQYFLWAHWYPRFGLLVTSSLGFKALVHPLACALYCLHTMDSSHLLTFWRPAIDLFITCIKKKKLNLLRWWWCEFIILFFVLRHQLITVISPSVVPTISLWIFAKFKILFIIFARLYPYSERELTLHCYTIRVL